MDIIRLQKDKVGIIILAAGSSSRLNTPKQLLSYKGSTLLQSTIATARLSKGYPIVMVTGAYHDEIMSATDTMGLTVSYNADWQMGMTSSIQSGVKQLMDYHVDAAIILMCDQPFLSFDLIDQMIDLYQTSDKKIVQCKYNNNFGPPVLFDSSLFGDILSLEDKSGARSVIAHHKDTIAYVSFPGGEFDIDIPDDYLRLGQ